MATETDVIHMCFCRIKFLFCSVLLCTCLLCYYVGFSNSESTLLLNASRSLLVLLHDIEIYDVPSNSALGGFSDSDKFWFYLESPVRFY